MTLTPHPLLVPRSEKQGNAIPLLSLKVFMAGKKSETKKGLSTLKLVNSPPIPRMWRTVFTMKQMLWKMKGKFCIGKSCDRNMIST
jgi:hypothetical protein